MSQLLEVRKNIEISLSPKNRREARRLAQNITNRSIQEQVYFNCLATRAVFKYFSNLNIQTEFANICLADTTAINTDVLLMLQNYFRCLPVKTNRPFLNLPKEKNRRFQGFIIVKFDTSKIETVEILGFVPASCEGKTIQKTEILAINKIEQLIQ